MPSGHSMLTAFVCVFLYAHICICLFVYVVWCVKTVGSGRRISEYVLSLTLVGWFTAIVVLDVLDLAKIQTTNKKQPPPTATNTCLSVGLFITEVIPHQTFFGSVKKRNG